MPEPVSFIIPAHNEERELPATLRAIRKAADATGIPYEVIVVDDSSTDKTALIAEAFPGVRVVLTQVRQIAGARNAGARAASGSRLFFVDADTRISAGNLAAALQVLEAGAIGGSARMAFEGDAPLWARVFIWLFSACYFGANLGAGAFFFVQRNAFEAAGGFDEQYFAAEETYLSMRLKKLGRFVVLREAVQTSGRKIRMHSGRQFARQAFGILLGGPRGLRSRRRLGLWYDGKREGELPAP